MARRKDWFVARFLFSIRSLFRDVWLVWLVVAFLTTLPYLLAILRTPADHIFSGVLSAYDDTFSYFAWMRQGANLQLLMCDPYTSEAQSCEFFLPLWTLLGFIARITGASLPLTFHIVRLLASLLMLAAAKTVCGLVMKSRTRLRYTLWLYSLGGGLGWLVFGLNNAGDLFGSGVRSGSADLDLPEAIAFRSMFAQVHFSVGVTLVCAALVLSFKAIIEKSRSRALIAGLLTTILAVVHPYMVVVVCGVSAVGFLLSWFGKVSPVIIANRRSDLSIAFLFGVGFVPGVAYLIYLKRTNEVLREWLRVTDTFSPPPWEYLLGFGVVGVLGLFGLVRLWHRQPYGRLLSVWIFVQAILLYLPVSFQRRFVEGLQLSLWIAASAVLFVFTRSASKAFRRMLPRKFILVSVLVFVSLTNIGFLAGQLAGRGDGTGANDARRYISSDLLASFDWLRSHSAPGGVLFSSYLTGNIAPSMTGLQVFLGHYAQTLRSDEKGPQVAAFYRCEMTDDAVRELFAEHRVKYVIYGPFERAISGEFMPPPLLTLLHQSGDVMIFTLRDDVSTPERQ